MPGTEGRPCEINGLGCGVDRLSTLGPWGRPGRTPFRGGGARRNRGQRPTGAAGRCPGRFAAVPGKRVRVDIVPQTQRARPVGWAIRIRTPPRLPPRIAIQTGPQPGRSAPMPVARHRPVAHRGARTGRDRPGGGQGWPEPPRPVPRPPADRRYNARHERGSRRSSPPHRPRPAQRRGCAGMRRIARSPPRRAQRLKMRQVIDPRWLLEVGVMRQILQ